MFHVKVSITNEEKNIPQVVLLPFRLPSAWSALRILLCHLRSSLRLVAVSTGTTSKQVLELRLSPASLARENFLAVSVKLGF
jgi:hypothetical protein